MKNISAALESLEQKDAPDRDAPVKLFGPLADVYTDALNIALRRNEDPNNDPIPSMESQQQDADTLQRILTAITGATEPAKVTNVYCTGTSHLTSDEFVNIASQAIDTPPEEEFVVVLDGTKPQEGEPFANMPVSSMVELAPALEHLLDRLNIKHYPSMEAWKCALVNT